METLCALMSRFAIKGQGCVILLLTLTLTQWMFGDCQLYSSSADSTSLSQSVLTEFSTTAPLQLQTSFIGSSARSAKLVTEFSSIVDYSATADAGVLLSSPEALTESSKFITPSVSLYPTSTDFSTSLQASDEEISSSFSEVHENVVLTTFVSDSPLHWPDIESTSFLDSVAANLRWDPTEGQSESVGLVSNVHSSTSADLGAVAPSLGSSPHEYSGSTLVLVTPTPTWSVSHISLQNSSEDHSFESSEDILEVTPSPVFFPATDSIGELFDMNSTQAPPNFQTSADETTSPLWQSPSEVSSPGLVGANTSCAEDTGCREYRGEDNEEEELRIKIIVGVVCGAILLFVVLGVLVGCLFRRRGKMSSGSKIDLSSYWDDSVTLSYINGHIDIPKDSTDEMISLDNDSFLNSLDSMSFTNTWTSDASKHTNF